MLPSFETAYCVHGPVQKVAAYDCGVSDRQFYKWGTGRSRCPKHKRQSVDRALGSKVDWSQYDREFDACSRPCGAVSAPVTAKEAKTVQPPPKATPAPVDAFSELYGDAD